MKKNRNFFYFIVTALILATLFTVIVLYIFQQNKTSIPEIIFSEFVKNIRNNKVISVIMKDKYAYCTIQENLIQKTYYSVIPKISYVIDMLLHHKIPVKLTEQSILVNSIPGENNVISILKIIANIISSCISVIFFLPIIFSLSRGQVNSEEHSDPNQTLTFQNVIGMRREKYELSEVINLINKGNNRDLKCEVPKGVLLFGPPGNGKTYLAKACAGECKGQFLFATASEFINTFVGVGPAKVRALFKKARDYDGFSVIYIDEIDSLGSREQHSRGMGGGSSEYTATINQLLTEIDGFSSSKKTLIILSTNQADSLDSALVRSGRIDRKIPIENPRLLDRELLLQHLLRDIEVDFSINISSIARTTSGFSRADITTLVNETKLYALRENSTVILPKHFELAQDRMLLGIEHDKNMSSRKELYNTAYHEIGHAFFVCRYEHIMSPLYKVTILPRGRALGVTIREGKEAVSMTKQELEANIMTALAGRACEVIFFGHNNVTSGCSSDLKHAKSMIEQYIIYGMDDNYGVGFINTNGHQPRQNDVISHNSDLLLNHFNKQVFKIINDNKLLIKECAEHLFKKETLSGRELRDMIKKIHYLPIMYNIEQSIKFN